MTEHRDEHASTPQPDGRLFEPAGWEERYAGDAQLWSGEPNAQLVAEASRLEPSSALDLGCGEGGDVIWLARHGWRVTGADFSANGLARAARHADRAGVADRADWWQVDARSFTAGERSYGLVTSCFLHPPDGEIVDVIRRLGEAVAPGGHLLVVGHAPSAGHSHPSASQRRAMLSAAEMRAGLPDSFDVLAAEQRARTMTRGGETLAVEDATLLARRRPS